MEIIFYLLCFIVSETFIYIAIFGANKKFSLQKKPSHIIRTFGFLFIRSYNSQVEEGEKRVIKSIFILQIINYTFSVYYLIVTLIETIISNNILFIIAMYPLVIILSISLISIALIIYSDIKAARNS